METTPFYAKGKRKYEPFWFDSCLLLFRDCNLQVTISNVGILEEMAFIVTNDRSHEVYVSINDPRYAYVIVKVILL